MQTYNINLIPKFNSRVIVHASQYDTELRHVKMNVYEGSALYTIPSGSTVTVRGTKPDNTGFEYECTFSGSVVEFDIKEQMTVVNGNVPCEIRINNGSIIGTANFYICVEKSAFDSNIIISETDLPLIEEAAQNIDEAIAAASTATSAAASAASSAATAEAAAERAESIASDMCIIWYGTSSSSSGSGVKVVATVNEDFILNEGSMIRVLFDNEQAQTTSNVIYLNVDSTGQKMIYKTKTSYSGVSWSAGDVVDFVYDGTHFVMTKDATGGGSGGGSVDDVRRRTGADSYSSFVSNGIAIVPNADAQTYGLVKVNVGGDAILSDAVSITTQNNTTFTEEIGHVPMLDANYKVKDKYLNKRLWYGVSNSDAQYFAHTVTTTDGDFALSIGATVTIRFNQGFCIYQSGSTVQRSTVNIDGTGAKEVRFKDNASMSGNGNNGFFYIVSEQGVATLVYDGTYFLMDRPMIATNLSLGVVKVDNAMSDTSVNPVQNSVIKAYVDAIEGLPSVTSSDNGKVLRVVNGEWTAVSLPSASGVNF